MKKLLYLALVICVVSLASCGGGCDTLDISEAATKISEAAQAYGADQSTANCDAYKAAIDQYISDLDDCDLVPQETIDEFQAERDALTC
ncbi:MAG: putative small secreted protein [Saprospiraceae bacterium]|jgi:predicted small secreted protein|tara:strand:+ start:2810 stop:3076 length:267 start_codon:yes stop_codon:yes gene_type:complete